MAADPSKPCRRDIEMGPDGTAAAAADGDTSDTGSLCFSDAEDHPWRESPRRSGASPNNPSVSPYHNTNTAMASPGAVAAAAADPCRKSCVSDCSAETDLESGLADPEISTGSPGPEKAEKNCRICHLSLLESSGPETGTGIVLGCSCKDDLAAAHRQCAETWFKIKGNKTCEICNSTARNVIGTGEIEFIENWNEANSNTTTAPVTVPTNEARRFWQGHRFLNFLLACMVFAFVISWLFHFNVPG